VTSQRLGRGIRPRDFGFERSLRGSNPHSEGSGDTPGELSFPPSLQGCGPANEVVRKSPIFVMTRVLRSLGPPHRNPCHRRATHRWLASPCGSGTASHRFRSVPCYTGAQQTDCGRNPARLPSSGGAPGLPLDLRLKTEGCAIGLYQLRRICSATESDTGPGPPSSPAATNSPVWLTRARTAAKPSRR